MEKVNSSLPVDTTINSSNEVKGAQALLSEHVLSPEQRSEIDAAAGQMTGAFEYQAAAEFYAAFEYYHSPNPDSEFAQLYDMSTSEGRAQFKNEVLIPLQKSNPQWAEYDLLTQEGMSAFKTEVLEPLQTSPLMAEYDLTQYDFKTVKGQESFEREVVYLSVALFISKAREAVSRLMDCAFSLQEAAELKKADQALEQMELKIKESEAQKKAGFFAKLIGGLEVVSLIVSVVTVVLFPSPLTIAALGFSLTTFVDSKVAQLTEEGKSLMDRLSGAIADLMKDCLGESAAGIIATVIVFTVLAVCMFVAAKSASSFLGLSKAGVQAGATNASDDIAEEAAASLLKRLEGQVKTLLRPIDTVTPEGEQKIEALMSVVAKVGVLGELIEVILNNIKSYFSYQSAKLKTKVTEIQADVTVIDQIMTQLMKDGFAVADSVNSLQQNLS